MRITLEAYVERSTECIMTNKYCFDLVCKQKDHEEVLNAMHILCKEGRKKHALWIYGPPNTGKSTILQYLSEIFIADKISFIKSGYVTRHILPKWKEDVKP